MSDEITVTLTSLENHSTESISVSLNSTNLSELCEFAVALLGLETSVGIVLSKDGKRLFTNSTSTSTQSLASVGIQNGDLIVVISPNSIRSANENSTSSASSARPAPISSGTSSNGGLDFSSLLATASVPAPAPASAPSSNNNTLTFNLPSMSMPMFQQTTPVQYSGITLDECIARNPNPSCFIQVLLSPSHPNLLKELNYHSPILASKLKNAGSVQAASLIWTQHIQKNTMNSTLSSTLSKQKENEMERRLHLNPMDEEANRFFGEKIRKQNVEQQYLRMMEEFPESMGRVLMLYIDAQVNGHDIQAFVDSGAQSTIMSSRCAEKCELLHLLDTRFEGVAVGVGTGKILGRVHIADMKVKGIGHIFPCTITIMDSEEGLGDKNMDFLLGLDMLKRHKCNIDLGRNVLTFTVGGDGGMMETPFLHEKDLTESKGGTKGFDADKSNQEIDRLRRMEEDRDDGKEKTGNGDDDKTMKD